MVASRLLLPATLLFAACSLEPAPARSADGSASGGASGGDPSPCAERVAIHPHPSRPYSEAVEGGGLLFFAGKIAVTPETLALPSGRIEVETRAVMESFRTALDSAGLGFGDVLQATVYLADIADYEAMNQVYAEYFPVDPPARETLAVRDIVGGAAVEISLVALCR